MASNVDSMKHPEPLPGPMLPLGVILTFKLVKAVQAAWWYLVFLLLFCITALIGALPTASDPILQLPITPYM